ncbi:calpain-5 isoform X3 [Rhipicephalus microplus]|uniref:calpain-5 isoform X3 n=1 Tax=Rhipicephalus microplus TaxID=6941 RepID=UPI003F6AB4FC
MGRRKGLTGSSLSYTTVRNEALKSGQPFVDPSFPADASSIYVRGQGPQVQWRRPSELCLQPRLFADSIASSSVCHSRPANAWFITVCTVLIHDQELLAKVFPDAKKQEWRAGKKHPGVFRFCFWLLGSWIEVLVDDHLPVVEGTLYGCRSQAASEFWAPLLEKAYAKFLGCYELLEACSLSDALVDMTGAAAEHLELAVGGYARDPALQEQLFSKMLTLLDNSCQAVVVCCAISVEHADEMGSTTSDGLLRGHAYQVVCAREVASTDVPSWQELFRNRPQLRMLCLRNPWHHQASAWTGMLGHWSAEWSSLSEPEKTKLGIRPSDEQEFWIPLEDFAGAFTDMCVCYVPGRGGWREESFPGEWTVGERGSAMDRAGGCINHRSSFLRNPQYRLDVVEDGTVAVLAYLLQDSSSVEGSTGHFAIGMHIMQMEVNRQFRVHVIKAKVCSSEYVRARGVFLECSLQRGRYCLLPTTFEPGQARRFLLRLFCRSTLDARELQKDVPSAKLLPCQSMPALATIIRVIGAKHLEQQDPFGCVEQSPDDGCIHGKGIRRCPTGRRATDAGSATCGTSEPAGQRNRWQLGNSVCRGHYH